jgi:hypothetical protein
MIQKIYFVELVDIDFNTGRCYKVAKKNSDFQKIFLVGCEESFKIDSTQSTQSKIFSKS